MKYILPILILFTFSKAIAEEKTAVFAGGCFWCMQPPFDELDGVIKTEVGFAGGKEKDPKYKEVAHGKTGHTEAIQITYDPKKVSFQKLLDVYWVNVDPLDADGQFCDRGKQYRPEIFYQENTEKKIAETSKQNLENSGNLPGEIKVPVTKLNAFYLAESYHQNYYKRNPIRYKFYRFNCGRDKRLRELWEK